jgi:hypothetical protein
LFLDGHMQQRVQLYSVLCELRACMSGGPANVPTRVAPFQLLREADRSQGGKGSSQISGPGWCQMIQRLFGCLSPRRQSVGSLCTSVTTSSGPLQIRGYGLPLLGMACA